MTEPSVKHRSPKAILTVTGTDRGRLRGLTQFMAAP
jgi:hypothetical protein